MHSLSIEGYYFSENYRPDLNDIVSYLPDNKNIKDKVRHPITDPLYIFLDFSTNKFNRRLQRFTKLRKIKNTALVYNFSMEDGIHEEMLDDIISSINKFSKRLIIFNSSARDKFSLDNALYIDLFAIAAVQRELSGTPVSKLAVDQRDNKINLLLGSVSKNRRTETLYRLHKQNYLQSMILGLLGSPEELTIQDENFLKDVTRFWGSADNVPLTATNSSQGYSDNCDVYDQSQVSYVCETWEYTELSKNTFITEKTYRPILNKHPFVIQGPNGILQDLQSKGFKTFSPYIDENYGQDIESIIAASKALLEAIKEHPKEIQDIVDHNYNNLHRIAQEQLTMLEIALKELIGV